MTAPRPQLSYVAAPERQSDAKLDANLDGNDHPSPLGVALVLHGGRETSTRPVRATNLAVLRMVPFAHRIAAAGKGLLVVARLRYAVRGWNGDLRSPVADAEWALDQLASRYPGLPIGLVGHSMGGRTALRVGGHAAVRSVAGLAPWLPKDEPIEQLAGRQVLLVHGNRDRMTSARGSAAVASRLQAAGIAASFVEVTDETHAMLRRAKLWHDLAAGFMAATLLGQSASPPDSNLLQQVIAGHARITI